LGWVDLYVIIPVHGVGSIKTRGTTWQSHWIFTILVVCREHHRIWRKMS
jgi:hypothetical protein